MSENATITSIPTFTSKGQYPLTARAHLHEINSTNQTEREKYSPNKNKIERYIEKREKKIQEIKEEL